MLNDATDVINFAAPTFIYRAAPKLDFGDTVMHYAINLTAVLLSLFCIKMIRSYAFFGDEYGKKAYKRLENVFFIFYFYKVNSDIY